MVLFSISVDYNGHDEYCQGELNKCTSKISTVVSYFDSEELQRRTDKFSTGRKKPRSLSISSYVEEPLQILEVGEHRFKNKVIPIVKVWWQHHGIEKVTWEPKKEMR